MSTLKTVLHISMYKIYKNYKIYKTNPSQTAPQSAGETLFPA